MLHFIVGRMLFLLLSLYMKSIHNNLHVCVYEKNLVIFLLNSKLKYVHCLSYFLFFFCVGVSNKIFCDVIYRDKKLIFEKKNMTKVFFCIFRAFVNLFCLLQLRKKYLKVLIIYDLYKVNKFSLIVAMLILEYALLNAFVLFFDVSHVYKDP